MTVGLISSNPYVASRVDDSLPNTDNDAQISRFTNTQEAHALEPSPLLRLMNINSLDRSTGANKEDIQIFNRAFNQFLENYKFNGETIEVTQALFNAVNNGQLAFCQALLAREDVSGGMLSFDTLHELDEMSEEDLETYQEHFSFGDQLHTAIHDAASKGYKEIVELFLKNEQSMNEKTSAIRAQLAEKGIFIEAESQIKQAFQAASFGGQIKIVQMLLDRGGFDPSEDNNALLIAIAGGGSNRDKFFSRLGVIDNEGLSKAENYMKIYRLLMQDSNVEDNFNIDTALSVALQTGNEQVAEELMELGEFDVNQAFLAACAGNNIKIVKRLVQRQQINIQAQNNLALSAAIQNDAKETAEFLISQTGVVESLTAEQVTEFRRKAIYIQSPVLMEALLTREDIDPSENNNRLMMSAEGYREMIKLLLGQRRITDSLEPEWLVQFVLEAGSTEATQRLLETTEHSFDSPFYTADIPLTSYLRNTGDFNKDAFIQNLPEIRDKMQLLADDPRFTGYIDTNVEIKIAALLGDLEKVQDLLNTHRDADPNKIIDVHHWSNALSIDVIEVLVKDDRFRCEGTELNSEHSFINSLVRHLLCMDRFDLAEVLMHKAGRPRLTEFQRKYLVCLVQDINALEADQNRKFGTNRIASDALKSYLQNPVEQVYIRSEISDGRVSTARFLLPQILDNEDFVGLLKIAAFNANQDMVDVLLNNDRVMRDLLDEENIDDFVDLIQRPVIRKSNVFQTLLKERHDNAVPLVRALFDRESIFRQLDTAIQTKIIHQAFGYNLFPFAGSERLASIGRMVSEL